MKTPALHELREDNMCLQKLQTLDNDNVDDNDDCAEAIISHLQERIIGQRKKRPVYPLGYVNFTKFIYFYFLIKRLKLIGSWFPERSAKIYLVCGQERIRGHYALLMCRYYNILQCLLWGSRACTWWRFKLSIKMCGHPRMKDFTQYPGQRLKIPSLSHYSRLPFQVRRETESVLFWTALWECFWDFISSFIGYYKVALPPKSVP